MKSKLMITLLVIALLIPMLSTNVFGDEVPQAHVTQEITTDMSSDDVQSSEKRISATIVSNVPEGLELPHAHYNATPWISAVGMVMLTGTILIVVMTKYHKSHK